MSKKIRIRREDLNRLVREHTAAMATSPEAAQDIDAYLGEMAMSEDDSSDFMDGILAADADDESVNEQPAPVVDPYDLDNFDPYAMQPLEDEDPTEWMDGISSETGGGEDFSCLNCGEEWEGDHLSRCPTCGSGDIDAVRVEPGFDRSEKTDPLVFEQITQDEYDERYEIYADQVAGEMPANPELAGDAGYEFGKELVGGRGADINSAYVGSIAYEEAEKRYAGDTLAMEEFVNGVEEARVEEEEAREDQYKWDERMGHHDDTPALDTSFHDHETQFEGKMNEQGNADPGFYDSVHIDGYRSGKDYYFQCENNAATMDETEYSEIVAQSKYPDDEWAQTLFVNGFMSGYSEEANADGGSCDSYGDSYGSSYDFYEGKMNEQVRSLVPTEVAPTRMYAGADETRIGPQADDQDDAYEAFNTQYGEYPAVVYDVTAGHDNAFAVWEDDGFDDHSPQYFEDHGNLSTKPGAMSEQDYEDEPRVRIAKEMMSRVRDFATHYHGGQWTTLYSISSSGQFYLDQLDEVELELERALQQPDSSGDEEDWDGDGNSWFDIMIMAQEELEEIKSDARSGRLPLTDDEGWGTGSFDETHPPMDLGEGKLREQAAPVLYNLWALVIGDGYLYGADDSDSSLYRSYMEDGVVVTSHHAGEWAIYALHDVPAELATKLMDHGTSNQWFDDGYEGWQAALPYAASEPYDESGNYDDDDGGDFVHWWDADADPYGEDREFDGYESYSVSVSNVQIAYDVNRLVEGLEKSGLSNDASVDGVRSLLMGGEVPVATNVTREHADGLIQDLEHAGFIAIANENISVDVHGKTFGSMYMAFPEPIAITEDLSHIRLLQAFNALAEGGATEEDFDAIVQVYGHRPVGTPKAGLTMEEYTTWMDRDYYEKEYGKEYADRVFGDHME